MTVEPTRKFDGGTGRGYWPFVALMFLNFGLSKWRPGTMAATVVNYAFLASIPIWLGMRIRTGYNLRRPHWTRESWRRYLRLAWMPVAAVVAFFVLVLLFDHRASLFGRSGSSTRRAWIFIVLTLMFIGVFGVQRALDWMARGEPSQQFTRTRWFQRQRPNTSAS
jgi:hypothetical protein